MLRIMGCNIPACIMNQLLLKTLTENHNINYKNEWNIVIKLYRMFRDVGVFRQMQNISVSLSQCSKNTEWLMHFIKTFN